jgi:hypothetical protein
MSHRRIELLITGKKKQLKSDRERGIPIAMSTKEVIHQNDG